MHAGSLVFDVAIILSAAFPLLFLGKVLKVPEVISYLVTEILIGPHALGWIQEMGRVEEIAELGVALILFFIGLHVPFDKLKTIGRATLVSGFLQLAITVLIGAAATRATAWQIRPVTSIELSDPDVPGATP